MEDFVPFEIAKKLKEKGFRELCTHFYRNGTLISQEMFCGLRSNTHHKWLFNSMEVKLKDTHERVQVNIVDAPTISQVLKWLRKEKKIFIDIRTSIDLNGKEHFSYYIIHNKVSIREGYTDFDWKFEQAALAGIEYVIDNLI